MSIEKVLTLSTVHVPCDPDFGDVKVLEYMYGYIIFVTHLPINGWLEPIMKKAREEQCALVQFDDSGEKIDDVWTWE